MAMFESTLPTNGDDRLTALQKAAQILTSGPAGPDTPLMYASTDPASGDTSTDAARKLTQVLHLAN